MNHLWFLPVTIVLGVMFKLYRKDKSNSNEEPRYSNDDTYPENNIPNPNPSHAP